MAETRKDIQLAYGIHRSPNIANEGELSECVNLVPVNGELVNIQEKLRYKELAGEETLVFIHTNAAFKHCITERDGILYWGDLNAEEPIATKEFCTPKGTLLNITSVGNTICMSTSSGIMYAMFKAGDYVVMDENPVFPSLSFRLKLELETSHYIESYFGSNRVTYDVYGIGKMNDQGAESFRNNVFAWVNPRINELRKTGGYFFYPFFVRYAYRMYDGSTFMHSAAIRMTIGEHSPIAVPVDLVETQKPSTVGYYVKLLKATLWYQITNSEEVKKSLELWDELIQGIDIYISSPLIGLNQEKSFSYYAKELIDSNTYDDTSVGDVNAYGKGNQVFGFLGSVYRNFSSKHESDMKTLDPEAGDDRAYIIPKYNQSFEDDGNIAFYKIFSITPDEITSAETKVLPEENVLNILETQETLKGEGSPSGSLSPACSFVYNGRLNIANIDVYPPSYPLEHFFNYQNGNKDGLSVYTGIKGHVLIESGQDETTSVELPSGIDFLILSGTYFFYPNAKAIKLLIEATDGEGEARYSITNLSEHKGLDGAIGYVGSFKAIDADVRKTLSQIKNSSKSIHYTNKLYVTQANNPFNFTIDGIVTVGTGSIIGIVPSNTALSQGQFGQFPLYVFSTDGIWTLEVGGNGLYSSVHPVSRDVCNNPKSITQIDNAIIFTTERGLKLLQGSEVTMLSEAMDGHNVDESMFCPADEYKTLFQKDTNLFIEELRTCRIAYDYAHGMIRIYKGTPEGSKETQQYVYSLTSGEFSKFMDHTPYAIIYDYPEVVVQYGQVLYKLSSNVQDVPRMGAIITRPMAFDDPFVLKILTRIRMHYYQEKKDNHAFRVAVFGSNDGVTYHRIPSLRQASVKYYRFVICTRMCDTDSLSGMSLMLDYRATGRMR